MRVSRWGDVAAGIGDEAVGSVMRWWGDEKVGSDCRGEWWRDEAVVSFELENC